MRRILIALALTTLLTPSAAEAKKKKPPASADVKKKKDADKPPPPGDKGTNEGAQGRINSTEDAARGADSPQFEHRP
jgi:hypothetical protein